MPPGSRLKPDRLLYCNFPTGGVKQPSLRPTFPIRAGNERSPGWVLDSGCGLSEDTGHLCWPARRPRSNSKLVLESTRGFARMKKTSALHLLAILAAGMVLGAAAATFEPPPATAVGVSLPRAEPSVAPVTVQEAKKPNILVIFGDDIGQTNVSAYSMGLMGYRTPNIDRIAREGMIFTDYYAEQSCTAGRSSFITGQCTFRTGLSKVGVPGVAGGPAERRPDDRRAAQAPRIRHRPVRQEPPRRPRTNTCRPCTASTSSSAISTT